MDQQTETDTSERGKSTLNADEGCLKVIDRFRYSKESKLGLRIIDISQYSPLATAGIKKGDLLVRVTVGTKTESLLSSIPDFVPGTDILFDLERNGAIEKIRFTASSFKDFEKFG